MFGLSYLRLRIILPSFFPLRGFSMPLFHRTTSSSSKKACSYCMTPNRYHDRKVLPFNKILLIEKSKA